MNFRYLLSDVFTDRLFGGNQLAVFLESEGLSPELMQAIAAELNLSETVFVGAPRAGRAAWPVRIFTPKVELPFAGHPTIGTALALARAGLVAPVDGTASLVLQEGVGPVEVTVRWQDGVPASATLKVKGPAKAGPVPAAEAIAALLGLSPGDIGFGGPSDRAAIRTLSLGVPFTLVPVADRAALARCQVDLSLWRAQLAESWAPHLFVFTDDAENIGAEVRARMFAPAMGIAEDPATGAAASALAAYLGERQPLRDGVARWTVAQGIEMGRPSRLIIAAHMSGGQLEAAEVGGGAVEVGEGTFRIPDALLARFG